MEQIHAFLAGPGLSVSLAVFVGGMGSRLALYFLGLDWKLDRVAYKPAMGEGLKGGMHSIVKWLIPFGTHGWRRHPFFTLCFFMFHIGLLVVPPFLLGHNEILRERLGFSLPSMPQPLADALSATAALAGMFLLVRRMLLPEVRLLSDWRDYGLFLLAATPLVTGILNRVFGQSSDWWLLGHIASVELLLLLAPFTRLSHMVLFFASRWQIGADYAIKRGGRTRGPYFPW